MARTKTRLFVEDELSDGRLISLSPDHVHYLTRVLRLRLGDQLCLFNGRDGEWRVVIEEMDRKRVLLRIQAQTRPQVPEPGPWLLFAPLRKERTEWLVEKASELGVEVIWPILTRHARPGQIKEQRLRLIATEAAEQSGRLSVARISAPASLDDLIENWPTERALWVADETGNGIPLAQAARSLARNKGLPPGILIGPEGGFSKSELDLLSSLSFSSRIGMGPRIMRAETAAIAAVACQQALVGDWT